MRVLHFASWYPTPENPIAGIFVKRQIEAVGGEAVPKGAGLRALCRALSRGRPDVVHLHEVQPFDPFALLALAIARLCRAPLVISLHSTEYRRSLFPRRIELFRRLVIARAAIVLVPSRSMVADVAFVMRGRPVNIRVVPNVVDPVFVPGGEPSAGGVFVHVSTLNDAQKNISTMIAAFAAADIPGSRLVIVGDGPDREGLETHAPPGVEFTGRIPDADLARLLRSATAFVCNSWYETFCVAAAEALASGCPVVTVPCGGPEEYVTPETGIVVGRGELAQGLREIVSRRWDRERISSSVAQFRRVPVARAIRAAYAEAAS